MGEAFKLHSQALVGYEDAMSSRSGSASPLAAGSVQVLEMQMAYLSHIHDLSVFNSYLFARLLQSLLSSRHLSASWRHGMESGVILLFAFFDRGNMAHWGGPVQIHTRAQALFVLASL